MDLKWQPIRQSRHVRWENDRGGGLRVGDIARIPTEEIEIDRKGTRRCGCVGAWVRGWVRAWRVMFLRSTIINQYQIE